MSRSSTAPEPDGRAASTGRGSRQLTGWVLECLSAFGSVVATEPDGGYEVQVGPALIKPLGRSRLSIAPPRAGSRSAGAREELTWESPLTGRLVAFVRGQGRTSELWLTGAQPEEGVQLIETRLEIEGQRPRVSLKHLETRPRLAYNFKVRWQGSEGREELRSMSYDPATGTAREVPPVDQDDFGPAAARRPQALSALPVREGFAESRKVLEESLVTKLNQRTQRARATASDEENRLNTYYSQLLREEQASARRRGGRRAAERSEQLKREWRQRLEGLGRGGEEARYGLVSAAVLWVPWLVAEVSLPGRPRWVRETDLDLHLKRWEGLACDGCGGRHTWLRKEGTRLVGAGCANGGGSEAG